MIHIELLVLFFIFAISAAQLILDYIWSDKRTLRYKRIRTLLFILIIALLAGSVVLSLIKDHTTAKLQQKNDSLLVQIQKSNESVHYDIKSLQDTISHLNEQLYPFIKLAINKYPNLDKNIALTKILNELQTIKKTISVINSFIIIVRLSFPTINENKDLGTDRIALGKYNVAGIKFKDKTFFYLNSDERNSTVLTMKDSIIYLFLYNPANNTDILGSQIDKLQNIQYFMFNYSDPLDAYVDNVNNKSKVTFQLSAMVNNALIGKKITFETFELIRSGNKVIDISSIFQNIKNMFFSND
jgi:hypothetical protein